ncbi:hypothetical protein FHS26_001915 [Rhizobium pisi]|jgi:hypothetical protein|uniref:Uncharacterized protein n=2 Tax=Rhizobium TaxID=379 RepID=A0A7W6FMI6_9HYPH|nr:MULTISPECIES: hypothetical protein [Rhizobium]MBB3134199.1 hypothetical protein [Rhizobium pisi]MBB3919295.1 hypothetical protein [Rhizobium fabae]
MSFLYLVVMVAANAKYSINSLLSPVPMSLFLEAENRARTLPGLNRFRCNALVLRPVFQKGTGLVTSGPVAAATSGIVKFETADSVKGWLLIDC